MKTYLIELKNAFLMTVFMYVLLCGAYPLIVFGCGQFLFPAKANGSLLADKNGEIIGSALIAQSFTSSKYFHPRPSAAGSGYDASSSCGTNLSSTSDKLKNDIEARINLYRKVNGLKDDTVVTADAVTCSGSGLDPHISVANAQVQAQRVAKDRNIEIGLVLDLIKKNANTLDSKIFRESAVNVLLLNIELDELSVH